MVTQQMQMMHRVILQKQGNYSCTTHNNVTQIASVDNLSVFIVALAILFAIKLNSKNIFFMILCPNNIKKSCYWRVELVNAGKKMG